MRHKRKMPQKPWDAIGMSRASWYRHGKPTEKSVRPTTNARMAVTFKMSTRTYQRWMRVMLDDDLRPFIYHDWRPYGLKPGQAEKLLLDLERKRRFLAKIREAKRENRLK